MLNRVQLFAIPWTVARQTPLPLGFSKQEHLKSSDPVYTLMGSCAFLVEEVGGKWKRWMIIYSVWMREAGRQGRFRIRAGVHSSAS